MRIDLAFSIALVVLASLSCVARVGAFSIVTVQSALRTVPSRRQVVPLFPVNRNGCDQTSYTRMKTAATGIVENDVQIIPDAVTTDAVICGGGPAGLLSAIMLAQKFPERKVKVYDRLSAPPSPTDEAVWSDVAKFYLIGLGSRGQRALSKFGVWKDVEDCSTAVVGRKDWAPDSEEGVERIFTDRPLDTQVLPRDKLVGVLHKHILEKYSDRIELNYGYEITPIDFAAGDGTTVVVRVAKCSPVAGRVNPTAVLPSTEPDVLCDPEDSFILATNLLIAADGTSRTIANRMEEEDKKQRKDMNPIQKLLAGKPFTVKRYLDDNQRIYKTVPMKIPSEWRPDLNYSARTKGGRVTFDALPANRNGSYCGVLLLRKDDPLAVPDTDPKELRQLFEDSLPQFNALVDDETLSAIAKKPPSYLPSFRFVSPRLHQDDRTVILGDCAHTVKPYFGLGANSALEDVVMLSNAIDSTPTLTDAVHLFSKQRAGEAEALVRLSRELDRPGTLGFITFILPIILDSIFHKLAPKLFETNTIAMLQREGYTFRNVQRRKRQDRMFQIAILGTTVSGMAMGARFLVQAMARALGRRSSTVLTGMAATFAALTLARKLAGYLVPGMAPADILSKTKESVTDSDTIVTPV